MSYQRMSLLSPPPIQLGGSVTLVFTSIPHLTNSSLSEEKFTTGRPRSMHHYNLLVSIAKFPPLKPRIDQKTGISPIETNQSYLQIDPSQELFLFHFRSSQIRLPNKPTKQGPSTKPLSTVLQTRMSSISLASILDSSHPMAPL